MTGSVHVGVVMDKVELGQVFWFSPVSVIPPLLHTHLSPPREVCDSPDQAARYHTLGPKLGASSLTRHLADKEECPLSYCVPSHDALLSGFFLFCIVDIVRVAGRFYTSQLSSCFARGAFLN
jgi:hypothetical protein